MKDIKYSELIKKNRELRVNLQSEEIHIAFLSNIMIHQGKDICEYILREEGLNAIVSLGDYDNIIQDSLKFNNSSAVLIFWEVSNIIDGFQYKVNNIEDKEIDELIEKVKLEIDIVVNNLATIPLLIVNKFSSLIFNRFDLEKNRLDEIVNILNGYLKQKRSNNMNIIDIDKILAQISISTSIDFRHFNSSKTLYTIDFYKAYFNFIKPLFLSANGKVKKALIFDCDNTLWKGILGEDGIENIKIYQDIQSIAVQLSREGVIIGLCSKNNLEDVDEVLLNHKEMVLRDEHIVIKKVNWLDKSSNLKEIAKELNIGLDSIVFVDDSDFEVNLIRESIPEITVFQVPKKNYEFFFLMKKIQSLFFNPYKTLEDIKKLTMYKEQIQRKDAEKNIDNLEEYLATLCIEITLFFDKEEQISRIAQMTQKTNQFNLTTHRYSEKEIASFLENKDKKVVTISVQDRYGDNGIVGLSILSFNERKATIDTLLMSCRVLGRNIEYKFMDLIVESIQGKYEVIEGVYKETLKNSQVKDLYDRYGFQPFKKEEKICTYRMKTQDYKSKKLDYIGVKYGR